jgi:hypothetical protein
MKSGGRGEVCSFNACLYIVDRYLCDLVDMDALREGAKKERGQNM